MGAVWLLLGVAQVAYAFSARVRGAAHALEFVLRWPWYVWVIIVLTTLVGALLEGSYRAVIGAQAAADDLRSQVAALEERRPRIKVALLLYTLKDNVSVHRPREGTQVFVEITNLGEAANFVATIAVDDSEFLGHVDPGCALWEGQQWRERRLLKSESARLSIGDTLRDKPRLRWTIYSWDDEAKRVDDLGTSKGENATVKIMVYSDPAMVGGPALVTIGLEGENARLLRRPEAAQ